ncbi:MAG: amino acid permease, partial [Micrococcaceae bacterium]
HMFVWFLAGLITIAAGLTAAELAAAIPETGGMLRYIERAYGKLPSFLLGWAQVIIYFPAVGGALSIIFATQFKNLFGLPDSTLVPIAIISILFFYGVNLLGSKVAGTFQSVGLVAKLIPLALIVIFGLFAKNPVQVSLFPIQEGPETGGLMTALGAALLSAMFAYDGWIHVGNVAGELKNPKRDLARAIGGGLFGVMAVYLLVNWVFLHVLPFNQLAGNENAPMDLAHKLFGNYGGKLVTIGILISVFDTINGYTMTGMRLPYTMGLKKELPFSDKLIKLNRNQVPYLAGLLTLVLTVVMILFGAFETLTNMLTFVIWIFYVLVFIAVFILRKKEPELERPYKVPLYPVVPLIAILGGTFIVVMTLFTQFQLAMIGILLTLIGIPMYYYMKKKQPHIME